MPGIITRLFNRFHWFLAALLAIGLLSGAVNVSLAAGLPAIQGLTTTPGDKQVTLKWQKNTEPEVAGYRLYLSLDPAAFNSFLDLELINEHTDTGLRNGTKYYYALATRGIDNGEGPRTVVSVTPGVEAGIPTAAEEGFITTNTPPGGIYEQAQTVTLSNADPSAIIFYTTDGTDPKADFTSPSVKTYTGPIAIMQSTILKFSARSAQTGKIEETKTVQYIIKAGAGAPVTAAPTIEPLPLSRPAAPVIPTSGTGLSLTANPLTLEVGEEHRSQLTALFRDTQGAALTSNELNFELSSGDGSQVGTLASNSAVTDQQGQARVEYLASRFVGTTIITARSKVDPSATSSITITQTAGPVASVNLPLRSLITGQDNRVNISVLDRFQNPVVDGTTVIVTMTAKGTQKTDSFQAQTRNGIAVIIIPANVITAQDYQAVASASGIQSEIVNIKAGTLDKLQESGPETTLMLIFALSLATLFLARRFFSYQV